MYLHYRFQCYYSQAEVEAWKQELAPTRASLTLTSITISPQLKGFGTYSSINMLRQFNLSNAYEYAVKEQYAPSK